MGGNHRQRFKLAEVLRGISWRSMLAQPPVADLHGEIVVITGGSRGLGYLLAREFARKGCSVAICARDAGELRAARQQLLDAGIDVFVGVCDVADQQSVEQFIQEVTRHFGRVDILVNNAGIIQVGPLESMTIGDFRTAMDVMFWGALYTTLAVLPHMRARGSGRIVNITSIGGKISPPHLLPYSCAKFAAVGLSQGLGAELARNGITVTTIVPGLMRTGSHVNAFFKGKKEREFSWFSLGASLPFISMDAERAARQIVEATADNEVERVLSLPAVLAVYVHGLFPGVTIRALGLVTRILPQANGTGRERSRGREVHQHMHSRVFDILTAMGRSASRRFQR